MQAVSRVVSITAGVLLFALSAIASPGVYRTLPAGYTQLEYVENTKSGQFVDTGVCPTTSLDVETAVYMADWSASGTKALFGVRLSGNYRTYGLYIDGKAKARPLKLSTGTSGVSTTFPKNFSADVVYMSDDTTYVLDGNEGTFAAATATKLDYPIYLFAIDESGALMSTTYATKMRIYYL